VILENLKLSHHLPFACALRREVAARRFKLFEFVEDARELEVESFGERAFSKVSSVFEMARLGFQSPRFMRKMVRRTE